MNWRNRRVQGIAFELRKTIRRLSFPTQISKENPDILLSSIFAARRELKKCLRL
jgi:hypothetical protein